MENQPPTKTILIKNIYLYLVCFVALMMVVISTGELIQLGLKKYVFTKADQDYYNYPVTDCGAPVKGPQPALAPVPAMPEVGAKLPTKEECLAREIIAKQQAEDNRSAQRQRDLVRDISFILVGVPLFAYHWGVIRKKE